ncbi:MAG TPA: SRPBCC family protein [Acidimicrobiales bacterium]|jgi:hypothetical protein|nr:SRPBCC family protein [Acidimicrobiales bacterium]
MSRLRVSVDLDATPRQVWNVVEDIGSHVEWMNDAVAIRFVSSKRKGVGATFECDTKVGPFSLVDVMEVVEWKPGRAMGIRHVGLVTGTGRFTLSKRRWRGRGGTRFTWTEKLSFPWWMGGPIGGLFAKPILRHVWRGNLRNLKRIVDGV